MEGIENADVGGGGGTEGIVNADVGGGGGGGEGIENANVDDIFAAFDEPWG